MTIYPILGWAPVFGATVNLPPGPSSPGDGGSSSSGNLTTDRKLNGALLAGFGVEKGGWRVDADAIYAVLQGDAQLESPLLKLQVDLDVVYGHGSLGRRVFKELWVSGGVRRVALRYDIHLERLPDFSRRPGLWDPLLGVAWHHEARKYEFHAIFEGGGFGVGADQDLYAAARLDWKPVRHLVVAVGYAGIRLKVTDTVLAKTFTAEQSLNGPILGIGFRF